MDTLGKIFDTWHKEQTLDNDGLRDKWYEIMEYLYGHFSDEYREEILTLILDFCYLAEQQAYLAGFQQAFYLWLDILK